MGVLVKGAKAAERNNPARSSEGTLPRFVVPIAASEVFISCFVRESIETIGRTSELHLLETIHCHVHVQEDIDPVRNKDTVVYRGQAL